MKRYEASMSLFLFCSLCKLYRFHVTLGLLTFTNRSYIETSKHQWHTRMRLSAAQCRTFVFTTLEHGIYSLNNHYPGQLSREPVQGVQFLGTAQKDVKRKTAWVEPSKGRFTPLSTSPSLFFSQLLWLCAAFQILNAWNRLKLNRPLHRLINTYPRTLTLQHWRNAVSLRYINRAAITVFMFELVVRFLWNLSATWT